MILRELLLGAGPVYEAASEKLVEVAREFDEK